MQTVAGDRYERAQLECKPTCVCFRCRTACALHVHVAQAACMAVGGVLSTCAAVLIAPMHRALVLERGMIAALACCVWFDSLHGAWSFPLACMTCLEDFSHPRTAAFVAVGWPCATCVHPRSVVVCTAVDCGLLCSTVALLGVLHVLQLNRAVP